LSRVYFEVLMKLFWKTKVTNIDLETAHKRKRRTYGIIESVVVLLVVGDDITLCLYKGNR
jgi:hypothetical protein